MNLADTLKLNQEELDTLINEKNKGLTMEEGVKQLMEKYAISLIILTRGAKGSQWFLPDTHLISRISDDAIAIKDTVGAGGQIKYVVELCKALSGNPRVRQLDLFTRLIADKSCSSDYSRPIEQVNEKFRIVRVQCGGTQIYSKRIVMALFE